LKNDREWLKERKDEMKKKVEARKREQKEINQMTGNMPINPVGGIPQQMLRQQYPTKYDNFQGEGQFGFPYRTPQAMYGAYQTPNMGNMNFGPNQTPNMGNMNVGPNYPMVNQINVPPSANMNIQQFNYPNVPIGRGFNFHQQNMGGGGGIVNQQQMNIAQQQYPMYSNINPGLLKNVRGYGMQAVNNILPKVGDKIGRCIYFFNFYN
jgi:hypothetical protein